MPYRRTPKVERRLVAVREQILAAAHSLIAEGGYGAAGVAAVAARAGVATGSVYRHFPSKGALFTEVFRRASQREVQAFAEAAREDGRPVRERIAAALETFARRALRGRRLAFALIAEPVDPAVEAERLVFRRAYRDLLAGMIRQGIDQGELPDQDAELSAACVVGAVAEGLLGPLADSGSAEEQVASVVAFCLRALTEAQRVTPT